MARCFRMIDPVFAEGLCLVCHPDTPAKAVQGVTATLQISDTTRYRLSFDIVAPRDAVVLPTRAEPLRRDGLWTTTCVEMFVGTTIAPYYLEYNYSPSGEWAAYRFLDYRSEMTQLEIEFAPEINVIAGADRTSIRIVSFFPTMRYETTEIGLSAVIEEADGTKSYWALAHPPGAPDFHHADCFALSLPAPDAA